MATALQLHLPPEQDLQADATTIAADAAEVEQAEDAAAAVEEGDEVEAVEGEVEEQAETESHDGEGEQSEQQESPPAESPAESPAPPVEPPASAAPATPPTPAAAASAIATRPPAKPPQPTALATFEFNRANAVDEYIGATLECQKLEEAYKRAKKRMEAARDALVEIENDRPDEDEIYQEFASRAAEEYTVEAGPTVGPARVVGPAPPTAPVEVIDCTEPAAEVTAEPAAVDPNAWRNTPIFALLLPTPITGKLIEEGYNTLGKIEDLRADTFAGGLKSIKGIGQKKADLIEEKILDWLSKNRDKAVLAAVSGKTSEPPSEPAKPTTALAAAADPNHVPTADGPLTSDAAGGILNDGDPDWHAKIEARSQQIFFRTGDLSGVSPDDCLSQQLEDPRYWESGYEAYNNSVELIECGYVPGAERDDWLRGWMSAKLTNEEGWEGPGTEGHEEEGGAP